MSVGVLPLKVVVTARRENLFSRENTLPLAILRLRECIRALTTGLSLLTIHSAPIPVVKLPTRLIGRGPGTLTPRTSMLLFSVLPIQRQE